MENSSQAVGPTENINSTAALNNNKQALIDTVVLPEDLQGARFLFVRHAQSVANKVNREAGSASWWFPELVDAQLSDLGIQQCRESVTPQYLLQMELAVVVVSPMRRAMQTAFYLLKDHPAFPTLQFVLDPSCREHLHTSGDVPLPYSESADLARHLFPNVDTDTYFAKYRNRETYFLEDLDEALRTKIDQEIAANPDKPVVMSVFKTQGEYLIKDECMELVESKLQRAQNFRDNVSSIASQYATGANTHKQVLTVSHGVFGMFLTRPLPERHVEGVDGRHLPNCAMIAVDDFV